MAEKKTVPKKGKQKFDDEAPNGWFKKGKKEPKEKPKMKGEM